MLRSKRRNRTLSPPFNDHSIGINLSVNLAAPATPTITVPVDGSRTNRQQIQVKGSAALNSTVLLSIDSTRVAGPLSVDGAGLFTATITLNEGGNRITAIAGNRGGQSPQSSAVSVTLDTRLSDAPNGLTAQSKSDGQISLSWNVSSDPRVVSYDLYRSTQPFTALEEATKE